MTKKQKAIISHMSGRVFSELIGDESDPPSDLDMVSLVKTLPPEDLLQLMSGPCGPKFKESADGALARTGRQLQPAVVHHTTGNIFPVTPVEKQTKA